MRGGEATFFGVLFKWDCVTLGWLSKTEALPILMHNKSKGSSVLHHLLRLRTCLLIDKLGLVCLCVCSNYVFLDSGGCAGPTLKHREDNMNYREEMSMFKVHLCSSTAVCWCELRYLANLKCGIRNSGNFIIGHSVLPPG